MDKELVNRRKILLANYRQSILIIFITISAMILSVLVRVDDIRIFGVEIRSYSLPTVILTFGFLAAVASFLNKYLDKTVSVIDTKSETGVSEKVKELLDQQNKKQEGVLDEISTLKMTVENISNKYNLAKANTLNNEDKLELIESIKKQITLISTDEFLEDLKVKLRKTVDDKTSKRLEKHFLGTMKRLSNEINELGRRAKVNLIIGSVAALAGVSVFVMFVFERVSPDAVDSYLVTNFAPRISLVIVIEIFAYFFLGLYKNNLTEIKYFHNELTNVESKYLALEEAIALSYDETLKEIINDISKTERNFLLKKGESTVSTEEKRMVIAENQNTIQNLAKIFGKK